MKGIRCQLCDGLVSNGRCKTCGMLYRNDEILYHLNESRHEHYKHATPKAKEMMRQSTIPLGDKASSYNKNVQNSSVKNGQNSGRVMTKEQIRAQQEKIRQEAMAKINTTNVPGRNSGTNKKQKKKGMSWIWWIVVLFYIIVGAILK